MLTWPRHQGIETNQTIICDRSWPRSPRCAPGHYKIARACKGVFAGEPTWLDTQPTRPTGPARIFP
eukprot:8211438-Pyramimonas_sp.AAC.1